MLRTSLALIGLILILSPLCRPAFAHHGNADYDETTPVTMKGAVTQFAWVNPHVQIFLDVKDDKDAVTHWVVESFSPGKLSRSGWTKDSLKPGDAITVTISAAKNGSPSGFLRKLVFEDGRELLSR